MPLIHIVAPASPADSAMQQPITDFFAELGFDVTFAPHAFDAERFMAGADANRAADINAAFANPDVDIVMALRGGYGSPRILDKIDYRKIAKNKKPFFGFSDITALQMALYAQCEMPSYTGFNADFALKNISPSMIETLKACLNNEPMTIENLTTVSKGIATGPVLGGTLSMITGLIGTPYMPNLTGSILVIEDVHEEPYRVDRMLTQARLSGVFNQVNGIVLCPFDRCTAKDKADGTIDDVLDEHFGHLKIPVVRNFPYNHTLDHIVFPIGQTATLNANDGFLEFNTLRK